MPLREARSIALETPVVLGPPVARFLSFGLGRVDMDLKWCWHWSEVGVLHLFRSWTGREVFRLEMRALALVPESSWQVVRAKYDPALVAEAALCEQLEGAIYAVVGLRDILDDIPQDRSTAVKMARMVGPAPPHDVALFVKTLAQRLPARTSAMTLGGRPVPIPDDLVATDATADGAAVLIRFADTSQLWLYQARIASDPIGLSAIVAGALLWPSQAWPLPAQVASWAFTADAHGTTRHHLRDAYGEQVNVEAIGTARDTGLANMTLDLTSL